MQSSPTIFWLLSRSLLWQILDDRCTDRFVCRLVWERLGYCPDTQNVWRAGMSTPNYWSVSFPLAPEIISVRLASVRLTRSVAKEHKQLLKTQLLFTGYKIGELYPRRTRRATAVSWLLAWLAVHSYQLSEVGPHPSEMSVPVNPLLGHPGDPDIS